jgi:hypothetical protein
MKSEVNPSSPVSSSFLDLSSAICGKVRGSGSKAEASGKKQFVSSVRVGISAGIGSEDFCEITENVEEQPVVPPNTRYSDISSSD